VKLLVTGGAGYIGSVVAAPLVDAGHDFVVFDNLSTGSELAVPEGVRLVRGDLLDVETLHSTLSEGFDGVLHLAALTLVGESVQHPRLYYRTNVCGTLNLLDAIGAAKVPRLIFSSTAAVDGQPEEVPVEETASTRPTNPYRSSKLAADGMIG
jgi:UDP-glucose 4-epimerase